MHHAFHSPGPKGSGGGEKEKEGRREFQSIPINYPPKVKDIGGGGQAETGEGRKERAPFHSIQLAANIEGRVAGGRAETGEGGKEKSPLHSIQRSIQLESWGAGGRAGT